MRLFFIFLFLFPLLAFAKGEVVINEIAWMGTKTSPNDEWIELYNNSSSVVNLKGWRLISQDGSPEINLEGQILAQGFFLLERTDDETVPQLKADLIYRGSLKNSGEYLKLINPQGEVVDEVDCSAGWFAGDNETKKTMERKKPEANGNQSSSWQTSKEPGGTPKAENSLIEPELKEKTKLYPKNIFINEILPAAEGPDSDNEWIEIFNGNDFEIEISGWQIRDKIGATKTYTFRETKIGPGEFLVLSRPETRITLQNSGDSLELLNPNGEIIHQVSYEKAPLDQSYNRTISGWSWSTTLTPGETNIITKPKAEPSISEVKSSKTFERKKEQTEALQVSEINEGKKISAKISEELPKSSSSLVTIFIALIIAISSGIIVLILKKRTAETN